MTTKEKILDELYRHKGQSKGEIGAAYDDCIDIVAQMPDRELALSREVADMEETIHELEYQLKEAKSNE